MKRSPFSAGGLSAYHPMRNKRNFTLGWGEMYAQLDYSGGYKRYVEAFGRILQYVSTHARQCNFREAGGKRSVVISSVASVEAALSICREILTD